MGEVPQIPLFTTADISRSRQMAKANDRGAAAFFVQCVQAGCLLAIVLFVVLWEWRLQSLFGKFPGQPVEREVKSIRR